MLAYHSDERIKANILAQLSERTRRDAVAECAVVLLVLANGLPVDERAAESAADAAWSAASAPWSVASRTDVSAHNRRRSDEIARLRVELAEAA